MFFTTFWKVTQHSHIHIRRHFRGKYFHLLKDRRLNQATCLEQRGWNRFLFDFAFCYEDGIIYYSEASVKFYWTTKRHFPEESRFIIVILLTTVYNSLSLINDAAQGL
jgi:hypothetical protein